MLVVDRSGTATGAFCARLLHLRGEDVVAVGPLDPGGDGADWPGSEWVGRYLRDGIRTVPDDAATIADLLARADAVISGPGTPPAPGVVDVSVSTFGASGPYAGWRSSPLIDWAAGGYLHITGLPDRAPLPGPPTLPAAVAGYVAALAVEVGLLSGPCRLDVPSMAVMASFHQTTLSNYAATGAVRGRDRHPQPIHPMDLVRCADGWVSVAVATDAQYDALACLVGDPALVVDTRFSTGPGRHAHAADFDARLAPWFATRPMADVVAALQEVSVPAVELTDPVTVASDPQLRERAFWRPATGGPGVVPADPIRTRTQRVTTPPRQGHQDGPPLAGTLVVDLTEFWAGPMATRILADLGATVVRVERPGSRHHAHPAGPFVDWKLHRGKLSLAADLRTEAAQAVVLDLAARADVLIENFRPGVLDRLGLGFEILAAANPAIVYVSLSGFGQDGPRAGWASLGPMVEAASGVQARTRYPDSDPLLLGHSLPDPVGGLVGAFAALNQMRAGGGAHVDVSQLEAYTALGAEAVLQATATGRWDPGIPPGRVHRCRGADAWVAIDVAEPAGTAAVAAALGCPEAAVERTVSQMDKCEVARLLQAEGITAFPVFDAADLARDAHLLAGGYTVPADIDGRRAVLPGSLVGGVPGAGRYDPAPRAGEHTEVILADLLGYGPDEIARLRNLGAVVQASDYT